MKWPILVLMFCILILPPNAQALFESKDVNALQQEISRLTEENTRVASELETVKMDRENVVKQAKVLITEKETLQREIVELKGASSGSSVEIDALRTESELLQGDIAELRAAREKDRELHNQEKKQLEDQLAESQARASSIAKMMEQYTPERIEELTEDRNRLAEENKRMAQRVFEYEKQMDEIRRQMTPLELDREELHRMQTENRDLKKRMQYMNKLEKRQQQLIHENAEYRESVEVLKAKLKETVPGLAKSSRISQKMMKENADMHYNLGTIFLHNKQFAEAIREYESVLELRPSDTSTHYNLGVLYDDYLKDREKALYHYQKYLSISPRAPDAKKIESYILQLELEQKVR